jgi:hypothetical protein
MERIIKATLFEDLLFSERKGRNLQKPEGLGVAVFFLEHTFVYRMIKGFFDILL